MSAVFALSEEVVGDPQVATLRRDRLVRDADAGGMPAGTPAWLPAIADGD
jgi:hypothetical protein